nr:DNA-directed DNA polymerase [Tanacetum cinerariifolium]
MLATRRYVQWQSRVMRYIDTRPNGDALRKCILQCPYKLSTVIILSQPATDDSPPIEEQTVLETLWNISPENKAHYDAEKEAIQLLLIGIRDEIYSTVDACKTAHEMWIAIKRLQKDLGASISLMSYTMYEKLGLGEPKPTRMSLELANRSIWYPRGIIENVLIKVGKFVLPIDFRILDMPEDSRVPIISGLEKSISQSDLESCKSLGNTSKDDSDLEKTIRHIDYFNTPYSVAHETARPDEVESGHLYSASANEIDEKKPELKILPHHLEYAYLHEKRKGAIAWKMSDIKGISPSFCKHKILMEDDFKPVIQPQRRLNPKVQDLVIHIHIVPKKGGMTVVLNGDNELIPSRTVTGWRVCIDYCKLNDATLKDHFPLPFIGQMLERLCGNEYYYFLDGFLGFLQIPIAPEDQEKSTFTCPYGTFSYRRMSFGLCNAPTTFQRCMMVIFHDIVEDFIEVFMDDFSMFSNSFNCYLANLDRMLARCEETNLVLN